MFNRVIISGRLVDNPELRQTQNGTAVCSFRIANETGYGERKETHFINIVTWKSQAELVSKYFNKGSMIGLEGRLTTRSYVKQGFNMTAYEVIADKVEFMGSKKSEDSASEPAPVSFSSASDADFEEVSGDDDLPF